MKCRQGRPGLAERRRTASAKRRVLVPRKCTASDSCHCVDEILEARNQLTVRGIRVPHELLGGDLGGGEHRSASPYELGQIRADVLEEQLEAGRVVGTHRLLDVIDVAQALIHIWSGSGLGSSRARNWSGLGSRSS
eukprot:scaffold55987_cov72-Phaeocystis_antarctica.AAC.4